MQLIQKTISISAHSRGCHLITGEIERALPELRNIKAGTANIHLLHTSAALTINENADPTVRSDMSRFLDNLVPEDMSLYDHTMEGPDDMTSHIKTSLLGSTLTLPVTKGRFNLGTWQGIYLCEFRNAARSRKIIVTIIGE